MMVLTAFCQYSEVRAILGVTARQLPDETLALPLYARLLSLRLGEMNASVEADFTTITAKPTKTASETKFLELVQVYSGYAVAIEMLPALPQLLPTKETDGKADVEHKQQDTETLREAIGAALGRLGSGVLAAYASVNPAMQSTAAPRRTLFLNSTLGTDPVVG